VQRLTGRDVVKGHITPTHNPTGGHLVMVPREDLHKLEISGDEALKMSLSMGAVLPDAANPPTNSLAEAEVRP